MIDGNGHANEKGGYDDNNGRCEKGGKCMFDDGKVKGDSSSNEADKVQAEG